MYVICSEERFVEISSPNECDKILKIPNKQTEPTDYTANCSKKIQYNIIIIIFIYLYLHNVRRIRDNNNDWMEYNTPENKMQSTTLYQL